MATRNKIIPPQVTGKKSGASKSVEAETLDEAIQLFNRAKERLKQIYRWNEWSGKIGATFSLTDERGNILTRFPEIGNLIRIDIPGPGPLEGQGYDWVRIEKIVDEKHTPNNDLYALRVRPVKAPGSDDDSPAHFYTEAATSSFIVKRAKKKVTVLEEGRNEISNTETENKIDKARHAVIGTGAQMGMAHLQWQTFVESILKKED
jgi:hypothetical protein